MTKYELEILKLISESREHLTAEDVFEKVKEKYPGVAKATCYNNLKKLSHSGLITKLVTDGGGDRYDRKERHDHMICSECGRITDVFLPDLSERLKDETGEDIRSYELKMFWVCPECRTKGE